MTLFLNLSPTPFISFLPYLRCLDNLSLLLKNITDKPTTRHFDPNKASTHRTVCCDNTTVTFHLKVDGLSVHPKLRHFNLVNLDGLSQTDSNLKSVTFHPRIFCPTAMTFRTNVIKGQFFRKNRPFLLTFTCDN